MRSALATLAVAFYIGLQLLLPGRRPFARLRVPSPAD